MRPEKPKRVEVNPLQPGLSALDAALTGLSLGPLPAGPVSPVNSTKPLPVDSPKARRRGRVVLRRETAHRGGRTVVVVDDFPPTVTPSELESLAKALRQSLGTGGSVKNRTIEIQGEQAPRVRQFLEQYGFIVAGV